MIRKFISIVGVKDATVFFMLWAINAILCSPRIAVHYLGELLYFVGDKMLDVEGRTTVLVGSKGFLDKIDNKCAEYRKKNDKVNYTV